MQRHEVGASHGPSPAVAREVARQQLQEVIARLVADYRDMVGTGSIVRCVARSTECVVREGATALDIAPRVEDLARSRLESRLSSGSWPLTGGPDPGT